ncbi:hypothetical protein E5288_WYG001707 [Bos mutus]|uniref:Uncharacterized protein n=1 Tax=Bos mutus TaxID=72004 RepID=A0A6B0RMZ1_9CETA|nr:hypothetical protein [Bos mutus]
MVDSQPGLQSLRKPHGARSACAALRPDDLCGPLKRKRARNRRKILTLLPISSRLVFLTPCLFLCFDAVYE